MSLFDLDKFYDRKSLLDLLKRRVLDFKEGYRQNVAFLGERYVGKTVLLRKFIADLDDPDIVPIYLDLENKDFLYISQHFIGSILHHFSKSRNLPLHNDLGLLLESTQAHIPHTVKAIKKIQSHIAHGRKSEGYRELMALPQLFAKETNVFCILILDEFNHLEDLSVPAAFQELGKTIMMQKRCLYIVASSSAGVAKKILSEKLSLLFGNFEIVAVESFDLKTSQDFIASHLPGLKIKDQLRNFLVDFTGGHPLYLQLICQELVHQCALYAQSEIFIPLLTQAIGNILFHPWGALGRHFDMLVRHLCSGKGNLIYARLLVALSQGKRRVKEISHEVGSQQKLVMQRLNRLTEMGIAVKNGNYYYLTDNILKYWIVFVFQKTLAATPVDFARQKEEFRTDLIRSIEHFDANSQKDLSARIIELFHCFENEAFYINGRRYKLPLIREAAVKKIATSVEEGLHVIQASTEEGKWFIVLKPEKIRENDIQAVLTEYKRLRQKPQRCVLISLTDLDENARLKALQERMWIWNEGELNTLLHLYDKPYILAA